jgi:RimJ/RimL family protein N-acetyltransferase
MTAALHGLLAWARRERGLERFAVRVRSDNPALAFYRQAGFVEERRVPLRRVVEPGMIRWVEAPGLTFPGLEVVYLHDRH